MFRSKAEQKVADAGYDPARLPPGQYLTEKWPVLNAGTVPDTDLATWDFKVFGEVEDPVTLTWEQLQELFGAELTEDNAATALEQQLVVADGDRFRVPSPRLLHAGAELVNQSRPVVQVVVQHASGHIHAERAPDDRVWALLAHARD